MHRYFLDLSVIVCLGAIGMSNASEPSASQEDAFAKAFAEAQAEIAKNIELACKEALERTPMFYRYYLPDGLELEMTTPAMWPSNLQSRVAMTRAVTEKLAEEQGKAIVPYLLKRAETAPTCPAGETRMLALLTLDKLEQHDKLARVIVDLAFRERPSYSFSPRVWVLLEASFCSEKTREAAANLLAQRLLEVSPRRLPEIPTLDFLAAAGNERTIELLKKRTQQLEEEFNRAAEEIEWQQRLRRPYEQAVTRIQSKLSLPEKKREQRTKDELLFMQTWIGAPRPVNPDAGLKYAVTCLAFQKLSVSTDFLIEQLKNAKAWNKETPHESQANWNRVHLALMFIASQKENRAVPAMVDLAQRIPHFQKNVEEALSQLGSPEAKEALQVLEAGKKKE